MNGKDYALGHGRRGMKASIPPSKLTKEIKGGARDHPGQQAAHIQDKSRGVGTWTSHPSCLEHRDIDIVLGCTLHSQCSCSWSPLQELGINLPPITHSPSQPTIPPESEGLSQADPAMPTLAKNLPVSCQPFPSSVEPGGLRLFLSPASQHRVRSLAL